MKTADPPEALIALSGQIHLFSQKQSRPALGLARLLIIHEWSPITDGLNDDHQVSDDAGIDGDAIAEGLTATDASQSKYITAPVYLVSQLAGSQNRPPSSWVASASAL